MAKVKSLADLKKLKESLQSKVDIREKGEGIEGAVYVKIAMATCGIASGAKETMNAFIEESKKAGLNNLVITQTGCMGACHSEPTVEVTLPGKEPIIFGDVHKERVIEIIEKYIKNGELIEGIIPINYKTV
ncbi:MAG: NADP oxidoreductase [Fusobacteriia bacterium 4572_132]|nr:MAG: NADP oxidoreductase [Fusobacteriia bacterium 4572_132]